MTSYNFLSRVENYELSDSGINFYCEGKTQLKISFLKPGMVRVFLLRPDFQDTPLVYPLAKTSWNPVALDFSEAASYYLLKSSDLDLYVQKEPCRLRFVDKSGMVINEDEPSMGIGWDAKEVRNWKSISDDEKFFGLGEKTGPLDKRGREWMMWNTDDCNHFDYTDPLYQSIPFFVGMRKLQAYGIYFNNSYRSKFNLGASNHRYYSFSAEGGNLDYFFIYGPEVAKVVESYTELTGRTPMPPKWALGYQQCRYSYYPDNEVLRIAETFRDKAIPADVIYLDIHHMDGYRVFTWDKERFPDPEGMLQRLKELGFKVVMIIDPGVKVDDDYEIARQGLAGDHFVRYPDGENYIGEVWPGSAYFPDFSRAETRQWWGNAFRSLVEIGINGFWNDMNEPAVWGQAFPDETLFHDEGNMASHKKMHNLYGLLMARACYEGLLQVQPNERPFVITRAGFAGEQRFTSVWTGDNQSTEEHLRMGIRMLQGLGISGVPFVGNDVGGFLGTPSPELFCRWMQAATFVPFFRNHTDMESAAQEPWSFGEQVEEIAREFIQLRYRFIPHLYHLFWEAHQTGAPIIRPLFWHFQDDENVYEYDEQFLVGKDLLIAPVTQMGHTLKEVYLPKGKWLDLNSEKIYAGGMKVIIAATLEQLPMFLRAGGIVVSEPYMQFVGEKQSKKLILDLFHSDSDGTHLHYEDDGRSFEYMTDVYRLTKFSCRRNHDTVVLEKKQVMSGFNLPARALEWRLHAISAEPKRILLNGQELTKVSIAGEDPGYAYDEVKKIFYVRYLEKDGLQELLIES